jgi:UrcA family protein
MIKATSLPRAHLVLGTALVLAYAVLALSTVAKASGIEGPSHAVAVHYSDLDLARTEGAARLYTRIRHAAELVCAPADGRALGPATQRARCIEDAVSGAVSDVGNARLSAYYAERVGTHRPLG